MRLKRAFLSEFALFSVEVIESGVKSRKFYRTYLVLTDYPEDVSRILTQLIKVMRDTSTLFSASWRQSDEKRFILATSGNDKTSLDSFLELLYDVADDYFSDLT